VEIGAVIPNEGPVVEELGLTPMGCAAEAAGAASLWVSDHLLMVEGPNRDYPFTASGEPTWDLATDYYEALTCCSWLLASTSQCRVGTAVLIAPQRHVLELAKITSTLDRLGAGRLDLGVGVGWNRAEMAALGFDPGTRGARLDEIIAALRTCWGGRPEALTGEHVRIPPELLMYPVPLQTGGPPIIVGGDSPAALRRAAAVGDGWMGIAFIASLDPTALAERLNTLREHQARGQHTDGFRLILKLHSRPHEAADVPAALRTMAGLGFHEVIVDPPWADGLEAGANFIRACVAGHRT
jgi:probable F420-dependent oxidoreductase